MKHSGNDTAQKSRQILAHALFVTFLQTINVYLLEASNRAC